MIIIGSHNGSIGINVAWDILERGGSALDAVEAATRLVESNPDDHTVGYGGYPNLIGMVELDAAIMDGTTLRAGSVGALQGYRHPISVARAVMEHLPHVMLVGDGAARFARNKGFECEYLLTSEASTFWREGIEKALPEVFGNTRATELSDTLVHHSDNLVPDPTRSTGTVNFIALDSHGAMAAAVSTSGSAWKFPGRVGDSPIIGAGLYADNRYGAAACTGWGELAMRACTAKSVVLYMKFGFSVQAACTEALNDLTAFGLEPEKLSLNINAIDAAGHYCAITSAKGAFVYRTDGMSGFEKRKRLVLSLGVY